MVHIVLSTTKGNAGVRYFPHSGFLGLTPVRLDGLLRTRCDEDQKPIQAASLTVYVRAYESRTARIGAPHIRVVAEYSQTLWRSPEGQQYASLGDFDTPFKITIPKRCPGSSVANLHDYRIFWRLEAVLEHCPHPTIGSRIVKYFDLALIRYDVPPPLPPPSPSPYAAYAPPSAHAPGPTLPFVTTKPRAPVLYYNLSTPPYPIGPSDLLFTSLFIRPQDPSVAIRSASLFVERRIELSGVDYASNGTTSSGTGSVSATLAPPPQIMLSTSLPERDPTDVDAARYLALPHVSHSTSTLGSTASSATINSRTGLLSLENSVRGKVHCSSSSPEPSPPPTASTATSMTSPTSPSSPVSSASSTIHTPSEKVVTSTVAATSFPSFTLDTSTGVHSKTVSLPWPESKSHSKWSMGETLRGTLGSVTFWVRVKVIVTSPTTGTETVDLAPREICVVLINDAERRQAVAQYAEAHARSAERRRAATAPGATTSSSISASISTSPSTSAGLSHRSGVDDVEMGASTEDEKERERAQRRAGPSPSYATTSGSSPTAAAAAAPSASSSTRPSDARKQAHAHTPRKKSRRPHTSAGPQDRDRDRMERMDVDPSTPLPYPIPLLRLHQDRGVMDGSRRSGDVGKGRSNIGSVGSGGGSGSGSGVAGAGGIVDATNVPRSSLSSLSGHGQGGHARTSSASKRAPTPSLSSGTSDTAPVPSSSPPRRSNMPLMQFAFGPPSLSSSSSVQERSSSSSVDTRSVGSRGSRGSRESAGLGFGSGFGALKPGKRERSPSRSRSRGMGTHSHTHTPPQNQNRETKTGVSSVGAGVTAMGMSMGGIGGVGGDLVRAWEEELVRIEKASKRGSQDMLGFWRRKEREREKGKVVAATAAKEREVVDVRMPR